MRFFDSIQLTYPSGGEEIEWDFDTIKQKPAEPRPAIDKQEQAAPAHPEQKDKVDSTPPQQARPSALTSVIYPVLSKLLKQNQEEGVIAALAQLKIAFDNAERAKPGITHSLIAQIIETLKR